MKFSLKKQAAALLSAAMLFGTFAVSSSAESASFDELANDVSYVYNYYGTDVDKTIITSTREKLKKLSVDDVSTVDFSSLLTKEFVAKVGNEADAKKKILNLMKYSLSAYFAVDEEDLIAQLSAADSAIAADLDMLFGKNSDLAWFDLFIKTRKEARALSNWQDWIVWAKGAYLPDLFDNLDSLQVKAMKAQLKGTALEAALEGYGWTSENMVQVCRNIIECADSHNTAEYELIKAAARSDVQIYNGEKEMALEYSGADLDDEKNIIRLTPGNTAPADFDIALKVVDRDVANVVGWYTTNSEMISFVNKESENKIGIHVNDVKGTADVSLVRDPSLDTKNNGSSDEKYANEWIVRFRVVVANELVKPEAPVWGSGADEGKLTWTPVDNAKSYSVRLYKDGKLVGEYKSDDSSYDFNAVIAENGKGDYTAEVIAYGDTAEEVSPVSDLSDVYTYTGGLDKVNKPVWESRTLTWEGVDGAENYEICFYIDGTTTPFKKITVSAADGKNSFDAGQLLADKGGKSVYATVQAIGKNSQVGAVSDPSDSLYIEVLYSASGKAMLEGYTKGTVQKDNSGIEVTVSEFPAIKAVTAVDGSYTLENIPAQTFTLVFKKDYYLAKKVVCNIADGTSLSVADQVLYYGDFKNPTGVAINHIDLSYLLQFIGDSKLELGDKFDDNMDISKDGEISLEELGVLLRNINKSLNKQ